MDFIVPDWPAPATIRACTTVRHPHSAGALSAPPFDGLNLGDHVGDDPEQVRQNREWLQSALNLPSEPVWLKQVHGNHTVNIAHTGQGAEADAAVAFAQGACLVMTADCLPVLLCDQKGRGIAAVHAGWRGLASGVLENAVAALGCRHQEVMAWLGPAIGPQAFEVGDDVVEAFVSQQSAAEECFTQTDDTHWLADIYALARLRLHALGITAIYGGEYCTYSQPELFYSYRRDGQTGRMASLIWFTSKLN